MFQLSTIKDTIKLPPHTFSKASVEEALIDEIHALYSNKVIHDVGLCISVWQILDYGDGIVGYGDGAVYVETEFEMMVFRPIRGECLVGKVVSSREDHIRVSLGFFDDIYITEFWDECRFDRKEQVFIWKSGESELYFDSGEMVRFRVGDFQFIDTRPTTAPKGAVGAVAENADAPFVVYGACKESGMGAVAWWDDE